MHQGGIFTNRFIRIITTSVETAAHYGTVTQIKSLRDMAYKFNPGDIVRRRDIILPQQQKQQ